MHFQQGACFNAYGVGGILTGNPVPRGTAGRRGEAMIDYFAFAQAQ